MPWKDPEKQRKANRERAARRRAEWLAANGPCVDCGSWDDLEVDHVDASTKVTHRIWTWTKTRRDAELAKCAVRCFPCHRAKKTACQEDPRGEQHWAAKLTDGQVLAIRASQLSISELARVHDVSRKSIRNIRQGKTWRHLLPAA